jgi:hypothetical protein
MTKEEFIQRRQTSERKSRRYSVAGFVALGLCMIGAAVATSWKEHGGLTGTGSCDLGNSLVLAGFVIMLLCMAVAGIVNSGQPCSACGKRLHGIAAQIAVATGNCGHCGEKAFD